jgi:hypothetical protein
MEGDGKHQRLLASESTALIATCYIIPRVRPRDEAIRKRSIGQQLSASADTRMKCAPCHMEHG